MCKLYYKYGKQDWYLGEFKTHHDAAAHWNLIKTTLESSLGSGVVPIYVETSKSRKKLSSCIL